MRTLINALADIRPAAWNVVLAVGAGNGAQLPLLRRLKPARLLLVEPNPDLREQLVKVVDAARGEEVLESAVTGRDAVEVTIHRYSTLAFSSFTEARHLLQAFPNLESLGQASIPSKALRAIVTEFGLNATDRNLLVLDAPGQLEILDDKLGLRVFTQVVVKAGTHPLYEGDPSREALQSSMAESGYELVGSDPEAIYPFAIDVYRRNDALVELSRLRSEQAAAEVQGRARIAELESRVAAADKARTQAVLDLGERDKEIESALDQATSWKAQLDAVRSELDNLRSERTAEQQRAGLAEKLEAELATVRGNLAKEQARIVELESRAKTLENEKAKLAQDLGARESTAIKQAEAQQRQLDHLKQRLNQLDEQLLNARDAMALAVRMQTLRENDLEDLRKRYADLHGAHQSQRELLTKLSRRLVAANEYFQQLAGTGTLALEQAVVLESSSAAKRPRKRKSAKKEDAAR